MVSVDSYRDPNLFETEALLLLLRNSMRLKMENNASKLWVDNLTSDTQLYHLLTSVFTFLFLFVRPVKCSAQKRETYIFPPDQDIIDNLG